MNKKILDQVKIDEDKLRFILLAHIPADVLLKKFHQTGKVIDDLVAVIADIKPIKVKEANHG